MNKKTNQFLKRSLIVLLSVCIVVFVCLTLFMTRKTEDSVRDITEIYMKEMNIQIQQKFSSIIELRLEQVDGIINRTPPESASHDEDMVKELESSAEIRNFTYLAFIGEDGSIEKLYGEDVEIDTCESALKELEESGNLVTRGKDSKGENMLILGKEAAYPMNDGDTSTALIVGISMEYLNEALFLDRDDTMVYSHIIDKDGTFVIRNFDAYRNNYYDRIRGEYGKLNGKTPEDYVNEMQAAIAEGRDYTTLTLVNGKRQYIYCSSISEHSSWYLITVMSESAFSSSLNKLDGIRLVTMIASLALILITVIIIFVKYYGLTRSQIAELNEARQEADRANKAKSDFLSSMSHDIRTPMNAIVGMTEIALKNIGDSARLEDCLRKVKLSSKQLLGLINDILDMSKIESGKMHLNMNQVSLRETMEDIVNIIQPQMKAKNLQFDIFIQQIMVEEVRCDSVRLNQVLLNILSNAIKFTPEGGVIDIYLNQESSPKGDDYVRTCFRVKDTGIGMSEEFQKKIWSSFEREDREQVQHITGSGLGMAIVKQIVEIMGGTIELQSALGEGSEFQVALDLERADVKEEEMILPSWNMLVVDDNEQLCLSAAMNLSELGVNAEWALDGKRAVKMVRERHARDDDYEFVLIDWRMPEMSGIETVHAIQEAVGEEIPIFLISAYDWEDIEEEAKDAKIKGFIPKPLFKSTLYTCLREYIEGKAESPKQEEKEDIDFTGKRILLAEDIDMNWEIANEILTSVGFLVERAENGKICVEKFQASEENYYDLVLMDIRMPVMTGYDAAVAIRELARPDHDLPIIAMTADAFTDDIQRCLDCGMNAHIAKPINIKELMGLLQKYQAASQGK